jgi:hypothetical protein
MGAWRGPRRQASQASGLGEGGAVSAIHQFEYSSGGSGELTKVTLTFGGWLRWAYQDAAYAGSRMQREV